MKAREVCPLCLRTGVQSYLHSYQINLDEAVILCEKKHCPYPLATGNYTSVTFSRSLSDVPSSRAGEMDLGLPDGARDLQAKVASHMKKMGHRLQKDAIGIQTGSPQLKKKSCSNLLSAGHQSDRKLSPIQTGLRHPQQNGYTTLQNGSHSLQNGCHSRNDSQPTQNGSRCLQSGFQSSQTGFHTSQNCIQSSSRLQSFTNKDTGAMSGRAWSSGAGSDGNSDKDSVFNSSLDSMDSSSSTGSSRFTDDVQKPARTSQYPAFQFGQCSKRALSLSDSVKSVQVTKKSQSISPHTDGSEVKGCRVIDVIKSKNSSIVNGVDNSNKLTIDNLSNDLSSLSTLKSVSLCSKEVVLPKHSITSQGSTLNIGQEILNQSSGDRIYMLNYPSVFPQWRNRDALCWLDVILCLVVHNQALKSLVFTGSFDKTHLICKLLTAHRQACLLMDQVVRSRNGSQTEISSPTLVLEQTSQGHQENTNIKNQMQQVSKNSSDVNTCSVEFGSRDACLELRQKMKCVLEDAREQVWEVMKARLKCERGQNESPVFAFPLLLKEHSSVEQLFQMSYRFVYKCSKCGREEHTDHVNTLPTFPLVVKDFNFTRPQHVKICAKCGSSKDPRTMVYKELPRCLLMHFTEGLSPLSWSDLEAGFSFAENMYQVTGLVQYVHNPDHFIAWLRNPRDKKWMKCDDLHQTACSYLSGNPPFSTGEIHIIMWEQQVQNIAVHTNNPTPITALPVAMETWSGYLESCSQASDIRHAPSKHDNFSKKLITAESSFAKTALFSNSILQEKKEDANNTSILTNNPSSKGATLLNYIQQKLEGIVTDIDSSPCSTLSTESETILLPNFVASTPVSTSLLRPVPKPISSVKYDVVSQLGTGLSETMATGKTSEMNSENSVCEPVINKVLQNNKTKSTSEHNGACDMQELSIRDYACSQIVGQKTLIQPSTVFCVPKKSEHEIMKVSSISHGTNDQPESVNVLNSSKINPGVNNLSNQMSTNDNEDDVNSEKCELSGRKKGRRNHSVINKDLINEAQCKDGKDSAGRIEKANIKVDEVVADRNSNASRSSQRTSKFKLPIAKVSSKPSSVSRDAFFTLGDESMPNVSRSSSQQSTEPTPWNGNLSNLNMVKQYLLSRTTGRPDHRLKFEGLNLKSATSTHLTSLSELDFRMTSVASGTSIGCPSVNNSVSCNNTEQPLSSRSSEKIPGCQATNPSLINNTAVCSTGAERLTTMQLSSVKPQRQRMKRKRDTNLQNNVNKWIDEGLRNLPGDQTSLKENTSCMTLRKRAPGGKKMRLVMQHARKSENSNLELKVNDELITTRLPRTNTVTMETKCETENVLQDLYEALNIPYNAVNSTMSDIMTDVDDILDFVSVSDVLEEQRSSTPLSCPETSACGSLINSDCWKRQPGRNSA